MGSHISHNRTIFLAACASIALHGVLLLLFDNHTAEHAEIAQTESPAPTIQLTLKANRKLEPVSLAEFQAQPSEQSEPQTPAPIQETVQVPLTPPQPALPEPAVTPAVVTKATGSELTRNLLTSIRQANLSAAKDAFLATPCTPAQRHNALHDCPPPDPVQDDNRSKFYAALFRQSFAHVMLENPGFRKDMAVVDRLIAQADLLAAVEPADDMQAALTREQSHQIRQQVLRIDRRYAQFNLLRLIPIGLKAFKGLQEKVADSG